MCKPSEAVREAGDGGPQRPRENVSVPGAAVCLALLGAVWRS